MVDANDSPGKGRDVESKPSMVSPTLSGDVKKHKYDSVLTLQSQLGALNERLNQMLNITNKLNSSSKKDEIKMATDAVKEVLQIGKALDDQLINDASCIKSEIEELLLKEDETDSSLKLRRQLRASGSGEDVEGLQKQIDKLCHQMIDMQSQKLVLETRLAEKDRVIKRLENNLANTLADMKHIRNESQKSFAKHDKRTKEAESRVKSMASELKRANEMATRYKAQYENERRRRTGNLSTTTTVLPVHRSSNGNRPLSPHATNETDQYFRDRANTAPNGFAGAQNDRKVTVEDKEELGDKNNDDEKNEYKSSVQHKKHRKTGQGRGASPAFVHVHSNDVSSDKTCLNVEDIIRKNHQYLEESADKESEIKLWRAVVHEMNDKLRFYCDEMMRSQGEASTLHEERMDLKSRLQKLQRENAIMKKELDEHAQSFVHVKKLQFKLHEEMKWSKLTPIAPTKIYSKARPKSSVKPRPIPVESWSG